MAQQQHMNAVEVGRGLAIVSVIYGHALAPWIFTAGENFNASAFLQWKFGAAFMMPFFFFLSGLTWRDDKSMAHAVRQSLTLILIALLASIAYDVVRLGASLGGLAASLGGQTLTFSSFAAGIRQMVFIGDYYSLSPLWFIVALAVVRVIGALSTGLKPLAMVALAVALVVLSTAAIDHDWRNFYQLNAIGVGFAFFMLGRHSRSIYQALIARPAAAYALLLIGLAGTVATFRLNNGCRWDAFSQCGLDWLDDRFGVAIIHGQIGNIPLFALTALTGIAFALGLSIVLARFGGVVGRKLESWGARSLNLLIVNSLFLHVGNVFIEHVVVPNFEPDALFFLALFSLTLLANIVAAAVAQRPLRILEHAALSGAHRAVNAGRSMAQMAWAWRRDRVSQQHE